MSLTHVHTPIKLGEVWIPNRVVRTAHATLIGGGTMSDDLIAYHEARAKGGVGLTIIEIMGVHWSSPGTLSVFDPLLETAVPRLVERIKPYGMKLFQQLWHAGHNSMPIDNGPPWSASDIPGFGIGVVPTPMTKSMIDEVVEAYAFSARKCEEWGLDGVQIHACHGYLPAQFLSPNLNKRVDDYGGSWENRARFTIEVAQAVRAAVSKSFAVGIRVADDVAAGGIDADDYLRLVQILQRRNLVDFVDVSMGNYQAFSKMIGGMHESVGYELPTSTPITRHIDLPTIVAGRFRTLEEADQVIRNGDASMVALTRAHIADPDLVRKTLAGHPEQVRPCIGCNQGCIGNELGPIGRMGCTVNPGVGRELTVGDDRLVPVEIPRKILIIGGGPAGMEAARVAALRGHKVILAEAEKNLGGALKIAAKAPTRHGIMDIGIWLEQEIFRLGVDVRLNSYIEAGDVTAISPDAVVVATGSMPRLDGIQISNLGEPIIGIENFKVLSSTELLTSSTRNFGPAAVVIDDAGHYEAIAAADYLISLGVSVTFVTRHNSFAPLMEPALMTEPALQRLNRGNFQLLTRTRAIEIDQAGVMVGPTYLPLASNQCNHVLADTVVFVSLNRPNRDVFDALQESGLRTLIVGDARTPRFLEYAIREGHIAGAEV